MCRRRKEELWQRSCWIGQAQHRDRCTAGGFSIHPTGEGAEGREGQGLGRINKAPEKMSKSTPRGKGFVLWSWGRASRGWVDHTQAELAGCLTTEVQPDLRASKDVPMLSQEL